MRPDGPWIYLVAVAGLAVGSFVNVCIHRLPSGESVVSPGSRCPACRREIRWFDNIPVASYAMLHGRCRACGARISAMYPAVELTTMGLFLLHYAVLGLQPLLVARLVFASATVALFVIDLQHRILPNVITLPGILVGFAFSCLLPPGRGSSLIGILVGGALPLLVAEAYFRWRHVEGLGMGDVKMLAMIGAFLGWELVIFTLVLASLLGSVIGMGIILARKGDMKSALPFGTFLAIAAMTASLVGDKVVWWYVSLY